MIAIPHDVEPIPGRIAGAFARRYAPRVEFDDLFQEGWLELVRCAEAAAQRPIVEFGHFVAKRIRWTLHRVVMHELARPHVGDAPANVRDPGPTPSSAEVASLLSRLDAHDPLHARIVRLRHGIDGQTLDDREIARAVRIAPNVVARHYRLALDQLRAIAGGEPPPASRHFRPTTRRRRLAGEVATILEGSDRPLAARAIVGTLASRGVVRTTPGRKVPPLVLAVLDDLVATGRAVAVEGRVEHGPYVGSDGRVVPARGFPARLYRSSTVRG